MDDSRERDIRDLSRSFLAAQARNEFYATFYPKPDAPQSPWGPISILSDDDIRKAILAYHLRRKYGISGPAAMVDDYMRIVVSRQGIGREQGVKSIPHDVLPEEPRKTGLARFAFWR
jgi:hypothetical protein